MTNILINVNEAIKTLKKKVNKNLSQNNQKQKDNGKIKNLCEGHYIK